MIMLAVVFVMSGNSQEYLTGFNGGIPHERTQKTRNEAVATLPFFDDFTNNGVYLNDNKWQSVDVLISAGFPKMPINYKAATLDVADQFGEIYKRGSSSPFIADSLLSVKIRLDSVGNHALTSADSLYFSFYYQPGGFGDSPERDDSLVLKFGYGYDEVVFDTDLQDSVTVRKTAWRHVWATEGQSLEAFVDSLGANMYFKKVMIPIVDSCFFTEDFRVLFYNYGTLPTTMYPNDRSNMDMWNVDFVYLDMNRSVESDNYPVVNFTNSTPSFLKRYKAMPYKHFIEDPINEIGNVFDMCLTNMDVNAHEVRYSCNVVDNNSGWNYSYNGDPFIITQYSIVGVDSMHVEMGDFIYPYNVPGDTTSFTIHHYIEVIDEHSGEVSGDTLVSHQGFYNYFAYDDGTPEKGYGLIPDDTYFAAQFKVSKLDTVCGVQMLFNRTFNDANYNFFDIIVWKDNNGKPGEVVYTLKDQRPIWNDSTLYGFSNYAFDEVVKVNSTFYVGIRQQYSKSINIGFDAANDSHQYNFYNAGEGWKNSAFTGSLMIRPVMGTDLYFIGLEENQDVANAIGLYPNPACTYVRIDGVDENSCKEISIFDLTGRLVKQYAYCSELNVSDLHNGVYMLRVVNKDSSFATAKLLISK